MLKINVSSDKATVKISLPLQFVKEAINACKAEDIINKSLDKLDDDTKDAVDIDAIISCIESVVRF